MAHLLHPGNDGRCGPAVYRARDVGGHLCRAAALPGDSRGLRRDFEALSRHRVELLLRGAGHAVEGQGLQVCPHLEVRCGLGLAPLLLGLSRRDGGRHRRIRGLRGWVLLSKLHQRREPRAGLHGAGGCFVLVLRGVDCRQGRRRIDRRQHRHQRHSNISAAGVQRAGAGISRPPIPPVQPAPPPSSTTRRRSLPTRISLPPTRPAQPSAMRAAHPCRCSIQPASRCLM